MTASELLAHGLRAGPHLLAMHLQDMTDADLRQRPSPKANNALWQLGHLVGTEARFAEIVAPGKAPKLPDGFVERYAKSTAGSDDASKLGNKAEMLEWMGRLREFSAAAIGAMSPEQLDAPAPESIRQMAPNVGAVGMLMHGHLMMHVGQIQVLRRKLGKPVLF